MLFEKIHMANETWRSRLATAIADRKIKRSVACSELGWSRNYITMVLNGTFEPTIERIARFCEHTGIDFASLFTDAERSERESRVAATLIALNAKDLDYALRMITALRTEANAD